MQKPSHAHFRISRSFMRPSPGCTGFLYRAPGPVWYPYYRWSTLDGLNHIGVGVVCEQSLRHLGRHESVVVMVVVRMAGNVGHGGGRHLRGCDGRRGRVRCHSLVAPAHLMDSRSRESSVVAATTSSLGRVFGFGVGVTLRASG